MPKILDLDSWPRRKTYRFFRAYERPFFSLCTDVDVTDVYDASRSGEQGSFFLGASHRALLAVNSIPELRYRIRGEEVIEHPVVHLGATISRPDETFAFSFLDFDPDFGGYRAVAEPLIEEASSRSEHEMDDSKRDDVVYLSVIPWVSFTSFEHAMRVPTDSNPRLVFGRHRRVGDRRLMPVSLALHHALADGIHAGRFFERFQSELGTASVG